MKRILIFTSSKSAVSGLQSALKNNLTEIDLALSVSDALDSYIKHDYCVVILDIPSIDREFLDMIRVMKREKTVPILALAPANAGDNQLDIFCAGANAVLQKPVDMNMCAAQACALARLYIESKNYIKDKQPLSFGTQLVIDPLYHQVMSNGTNLSLTRKEFELLFFLASYPMQVMTMEQLYAEYELGGEDTVRTHIATLRKKLSQAGCKDCIWNVRGVGYKFIPPENAKTLNLSK